MLDELIDGGRGGVVDSNGEGEFLAFGEVTIGSDGAMIIAEN